LYDFIIGPFRTLFDQIEKVIVFPGKYLPFLHSRLRVQGSGFCFPKQTGGLISGRSLASYKTYSRKSPDGGAVNRAGMSE
jgi:hypothetical protein